MVCCVVCAAPDTIHLILYHHILPQIGNIVISPSHFRLNFMFRSSNNGRHKHILCRCVVNYIHWLDPCKPRRARCCNSFRFPRRWGYHILPISFAAAVYYTIIVSFGNTRCCFSLLPTN